jgi:DNA invertase Pin-like site-specific DNA recombinase
MTAKSLKTLGNPSIAIGYLRLSPGEYTGESPLGFDAQKAAIERWAVAGKVKVIGYFRDEGVSGDVGEAERPQLQAALEAVRTRGAGVLVVSKRDRLARDVMIAALITVSARRAGAVVRSADGVGAGDSPADELITTVVDATSKYELQQIRARTRAALAAKKARGEFLGNAPYGMRLATDGVHLISEPKERFVIAQAVALRSRGASLRSIAFALTEAGYRSRTGGYFDHKQIAAMLKRAEEQVAAMPKRVERR